MGTIRKIGKSLYLKGNFEERDKNINWAHFVQFPTIFEAYGAGIRSGNWHSCTSINTPEYVIENYLGDNIHDYMPALTKSERKEFWDMCAVASKEASKDYPETLKPVIDRLNVLLNKLPMLCHN